MTAGIQQTTMQNTTPPVQTNTAASPIAQAAKHTLTVNKYYIVDVTIFIVVAVAFTVSILLLQQYLNTYTGIQQAISGTLLTYQQNDAVINQFKKSDIAKTNLQNALPTQNTIVDWVRQVEVMAHDCNIQETLSFTSGDLTKDGILIPRTAASNGNTIGASIQTSGSYNDILSFIDMLNHSFYYTKVTTISITANKPAASPTPGSVLPTAPTTQYEPVSAQISLQLFIQKITN